MRVCVYAYAMIIISERQNEILFFSIDHIIDVTWLINSWHFTDTTQKHDWINMKKKSIWKVKMIQPRLLPQRLHIVKLT